MVKYPPQHHHHIFFIPINIEHMCVPHEIRHLIGHYHIVGFQIAKVQEFDILSIAIFEV